MSYSKLGILNLSLGKIGVSKIASTSELTGETSEAAKAANIVWDYILDEVLEARPWHFAKTRSRLHRIDVTPAFDFDYAYILPDNFLRFIYPKPDYPAIYPGGSSYNAYDHVIESLLVPDGLEKVTNGAFTGAATSWTLGTGWTYGTNSVAKAAGAVNTLSQVTASMVTAPVVDEIYLLDLDVSSLDGGSLLPSIGGGVGTPIAYDGDTNTSQHIQAINITGALIFTPSASAVVCTIDNVSLIKCLDKMALFIDYEDTDDNPLYIGYIRRIIDPTRWSPSFVSCLGFRLGAEMSLKLTEGQTKYQTMMGLYDKALIRADSVTQSMDSVPNETGSDDWEGAGRG